MVTCLGKERRWGPRMTPGLEERGRSGRVSQEVWGVGRSGEDPRVAGDQGETWAS